MMFQKFNIYQYSNQDADGSFKDATLIGHTWLPLNEPIKMWDPATKRTLAVGTETFVGKKPPSDESMEWNVR